MENENKDSPKKWGVDEKMSEIVEQLGRRVDVMDNKVNDIDGRQTVLSKEFELFGGWFKESITSLRETTEKIEQSNRKIDESNTLLRESLAITKLETEFKLKELEMKQESRMKEFEDNQVICEQAKEIKKLSNTDKFKVWWADPNTLWSKLGLMFGGVLALALANHFNILDQALQLLTK